MHTFIKGIEYFLPEKRESNADLKIDNPDWIIDDIEKKTGVTTRRISSNNQTATDLAEEACKKLIKSGLETQDIDFIILVTQSPDYTLPTSACILQDRLGVGSCIAFDVNLGCSGFVYGLAISSSLISSGLAKQGILVCSDTYTKYIDKNEDPRDYRVNSGKIKRELGFEVTMRVPDGIEEVKRIIQEGVIQDPEDQKYYNIPHERQD